MDRRSMAVTSLALTLVLAMALPVGAMAKGKPTTEATNNLSVPTIVVGGGTLSVPCGVETPSLLVPPTGTPSWITTTDPEDYYFVQGTHKWQAQCYSTSNVPDVMAGWGDNLTGDAKLKVGSPIRVELGLFNTTDGVTMDGYDVIKLDETALDRESAYGTLATSDGLGGFSATPKVFSTVRVFDSKVTFSIKNVATGAYVVQPGTPATAEINATGNVVYGYNLRVTAAGDYEITYVTPSVKITSANKAASTFTDTTVTLVIKVIAGGGGGGHR
jgi:hypothetical protein